MEKESSDEWFDYYACEAEVEKEEFSYHFEIHLGKEKYIFDAGGKSRICVSGNSGFQDAGLGKGSGDVSDLCGPLL